MNNKNTELHSASIDKRLAELFLHLAKIDGTSFQEREVADYIDDFLHHLGFTTNEDDTGEVIGGNAGNIICKIGTGGDLLLLAHMDTASSTAKLNPRILPDRITSDGTTILGADNRAGITAYLYALEKLTSEGAALNDFTVAFTVGEEIDLLGSRHLKLDNIKYGIVFDSHLRPGKFIYKGYGAKTFNIEVIGKPAHAGIAPEKGINAIAVAADALSQIRQGRISDQTVANIGTIRGGIATNVVSEKVEIEGESRSLSITEIDNYLQEAEEIFLESAEKFGAKIRFSSEWAFQPYEIKPDNPVRLKIERALYNVGLNPEPMISPGGSDANNLNAKGINAVNIGIGAQNPHGFDEYIMLEDLNSIAQIALEIMKK